MFVIDIGPIENNNPQTSYKLVFGQNVSFEEVLNSLTRSAKLREDLGFTTTANTIATVQEAQKKLADLEKHQSSTQH